MEKTYNSRNIALTILCRILEDNVPSHVALADGLGHELKESKAHNDSRNTKTQNDRAHYEDRKAVTQNNKAYNEDRKAVTQNNRAYNEDRKAISKEDRSFIKRLVVGTLERIITIDDIINRYSSVKISKQKPVIRNLLRMSIFQIIFLNVPDSAACNEAVKLAKKRGFNGLSGFVNGILRKVCSEKDTISKQIYMDTTAMTGTGMNSAGTGKTVIVPVEMSDTVKNAIKDTYKNTIVDDNLEISDGGLPLLGGKLKKLEYKYSLPEWIIRLYIDRFGYEKATGAFRYFLKESTVQIRCNISRITPDELAKKLENEGLSLIRREYKAVPDKDGELIQNTALSIEKPSAERTTAPADMSESCKKCMTILGMDRMDRIGAFNDGLFTVQDFSSVLAGENPTREMIREYIESSACTNVIGKNHKGIDNKGINHKRNNNKGNDNKGNDHNVNDINYSLNPTDKSGNSDSIGNSEISRYELKILDMCASPGGKTLNLADRLKNEGFKAHFTSCDVSEDKLKRIRENIERCGFDNIECAINDGTVFRPEFEDAFDIIIADVPCSGLGVIGRKPDIKLNASPEKLHELVGLQQSILKNAVRYVMKGGFLIFSTCTVGRDENEDNVRFIEQNGFEQIVSKQICPGEYDCDGFFFALMKKRR